MQLLADRAGYGPCMQTRSLSRRQRHTSARPAAAAQQVAEPAQLPADLRNATAVLQVSHGDSAPPTNVYVLAMSHVSKKSCDQVRELIEAVQPEVVVVELCKDRLALLVDEEEQPRVKDTWHIRKILFDGLPDAPGWPSPQDLRADLLTQPGQPVATADIEADVSRLLSTGLFGKVRPAAEPAGRLEAPLYGVIRAEGPAEDATTSSSSSSSSSSASWPPGASGDLQLQLVPPLGSMRFVVEPRTLPNLTSLTARLDSSLKDAGISGTQLEAAVAKVMQQAAEAAAAAAAAAEATPDSDDKKEEEDDSSEQVSTIQTLLNARVALMQLFPVPDDIVVEFNGVETGKAEAVVCARKPEDPRFVSGLEASALGGNGLGINSFKPVRSSVQLSPKMSLPAEATERLSASRAAQQAERVVRVPEGWSPGTQVQPWQQQQVEEPAQDPLPSSPVVDVLGRLLTRPYAGLQNKAGEAAGVGAGAAWRAALNAATAVGTQQVVLGDRPAGVTERRLANVLLTPALGRLAAAAGLVAAGAAAAVNHAAAQLLPDVAAAAGVGGDAAAVGVGVAAATAALWPVLGPYLEVWRFSNMSGEEVEATVAIKEPVQANLDQRLLFPGEDALLKWPGAMVPLLDERDAYMARVIAAAAQGAPTGAPAYVAGALGNGQLVWRYAMAPDAPARSSPAGVGDGAYVAGQPPRSVVAVLGSAHVRGICQQWPQATSKAGQVAELLEC